jgi:hypothetical protein
MMPSCVISERDGRRGRPPVEQLSIDYDVPMELAVLLVGDTESETARNIQLFVDYIGTVTRRFSEYVITASQQGG